MPPVYRPGPPGACIIIKFAIVLVDTMATEDSISRPTEDTIMGLGPAVLWGHVVLGQVVLGDSWS